MAAVEEYLVRRDQELVLLFTPPFDRAPLDPGYIKGYPPGIRENGGQYTHAAIWSVMAFAALGDGDKAGELFSILNPINHASTRAGVHRYKVEPYVVGGRRLCGAPHVGRGRLDLVHRLGGLDVPRRDRVAPRVPAARRAPHLDPCIPRAWRALRDHVPLSRVALRDHRREPAGVPRGIATVEVDGTPPARGERDRDARPV